MAPLLAKYAYLQSLAKKICSRPRPEPQKRKSAGKTQVLEAAGLLKKERKKALKKSQEREEKAAEAKARAPAEKSQVRKPVAAEEEEASSSTGAPADGLDKEPLYLPWTFCGSACLKRYRRRGARAAPRSCLPPFWRKDVGGSGGSRSARDRKEKQQRELRAKRKAPRAPEARRTLSGP
ncbi:hypothetical protein J1605_001244 [Eschrichtius robustus]|uniref:Surfeit locus protein 6 n=1 Tax=Eschrichtius robustus TaxID=9764 RepID=A0AB34GAL7_ESCRO|nr:hypothetical protein J1605_001244 [Eschrichtius robustus]